MTILAQDVGTGSDPTVWGPGTDGIYTWNHTAGSSSLSRGGGELSALGGTQTNTMLYGPSATDQDAQVNVTQNDSGNFIGAVIRCSGTTFYYADIGVYSNFFVVGKCVSGTFTDLQFYSFTPSPGTKYTMKLQAIGTTINAAIWVAGGSQPAWQISFTDTSIASGQAGCYFFGGGASAGTFDNYIMTDTASVTTSTRTISALAAILTTKTRSIAATVALLTTKARTIPSSAALQSTEQRSIPAAVALLLTKTRVISAETALLVTVQRLIQASAAIQATQHRTISAHASISGGIVIDRTNATLIVRSGDATLIVPNGSATIIT